MSFIIDNIEGSNSSLGSPQQAKYKVVFLGDQSVGKTSIINKYIFDIFDDQSNPTIGIDFISKSTSINNKIVRFQLWDTAGQERFRSLIPNYLRDAQVALLVFDLQNETSLENIESWHQKVAEERENCIILLVGNKTDLGEGKSGKEMADKLNLEYMEVSAKNGEGVEALFKKVAELVGEKEKTPEFTFASPVRETKKIILQDTQAPKKWCC